MLRAEQMIDLQGGLRVQREADGRSSILNLTSMALRDAILVDVGPGGENRYTTVGSIPSGEVVAMPESAGSFSEYQPIESSDGPDWAKLDDFLEPLCSYNWGKPEDEGELRLVAWIEGSMPGQELTPGVDRHRGFTLVVVHLEYGPPPSPDLPVYTSASPGSFDPIEPN
jgi:hypothetical protein